MHYQKGKKIICISLLLLFVFNVHAVVKDPSRKVNNITIGNVNTATIDFTRVVLNEAKTIGYDVGCDMPKLLSDEALAQIYTYDSEVVYSINERPKDAGIIKVGILLKAAGDYRISVSRLDCELILVDKKLNEIHYLSQGAYSFSSIAGTFNDRFEIHIPIFGDMNRNGVLEMNDAEDLVAYLLGKKSANFNALCGDSTEDGKISIADVVSIIRKLQP